jgi:tetratricopeptide (TPR) repeat protein
VVAVTIAVAALARRQPALLATWLCFLATLLPVIGLVKMGFQARADRYAYLPSIGPIVLGAAGIAALARRAVRSPGLLRASAAAGALAVLALAGLTARQARVWKDDLTLWSYQVETAPGLSWLAYQNRGVALSKLGRLEEAAADYGRAIAMNPRSAELFYNRANVNARLGRLEEALRDYGAAIGLAPRPHPDYFTNRSVVLRWMGREEEAAADRREAERAQALRRRGPLTGDELRELSR